jgi:aldehyde:ferredoxin oxidoreductase
MLHVDLGTGRSQHHALEPSRLRACLGGIGLGTSLLLEYCPAGADAFSPPNPLVFASAPLVGTPITTTAKFAVVTKSPLTGFIADSLSSSHFALELKRLGVDALVITGRAPSLVYLFVHGDRVRIESADALSHKAWEETRTFVRERTHPDACVASIGQAGENRVRFATISNDGRHAGRGGVGAVMGAKNLKAVAVLGSRETTVAAPGEVAALAGSLRLRSVGPLTEKYRRVGTVANVGVFNRLGTLPTRNFRQSTFEAAEALSGETLTATSFSRRNGCASCTIRCERLFRSQDAAGHQQRLEYETVFALGSMCGIGDPGVVIEAARLCDVYGLDTISAGGTIAWAMEAAERGLLADARALGLRFGNGEGVLAAIRAIAARDGVGALLAEGSRRAAGEVGGDSSDWAMHVKGLELPGYEPRSLKTMALGLAVSPRGACHNRSGAYEADFSGEVNRFHGDAARGSVVARSEDFAAVLDSLIVCKFLRKCFTDFYRDASEILHGVTGWDFSADELRTAGERIHTMKKLFNVREGWRTEDDWLPKRLLTEPLPTGVASGVTLSRAELQDMLRGYYQARQWDEHGFVPEWKASQLGVPP